MVRIGTRHDTFEGGGHKATRVDSMCPLIRSGKCKDGECRFLVDRKGGWEPHFADDADRWG